MSHQWAAADGTQTTGIHLRSPKKQPYTGQEGASRPSLWLRRLIPVMSGAGKGFRTRRRVLVLLSLVFVFAQMACDRRVMSMEGGCGWTVFVPHP